MLAQGFREGLEQGEPGPGQEERDLREQGVGRAGKGSLPGGRLLVKEQEWPIPRRPSAQEPLWCRGRGSSVSGRSRPEPQEKRELSASPAGRLLRAQVSAEGLQPELSCPSAPAQGCRAWGRV